MNADLTETLGDGGSDCKPSRLQMSIQKVLNTDNIKHLTGAEPMDNKRQRNSLPFHLTEELPAHMSFELQNPMNHHQRQGQLTDHIQITD